MPYFNKFQAEALKRNIDIQLTVSLEFGDMGGAGEDGKCVAHTRIVIDKTFWKYAWPQRKEVLLLHELGHCLLGREHTPGLLDSGQPSSLMNGQYRPDLTFYENEVYYLDELFGH